MNMPAEHQVLQDRHVLKQLDILKGASNAETGDLMGL